MTMTLAELLADLEVQVENGVDPETPVLIAIQPNWPLVHGLAGLAAVYTGEDQTAPCTHLLLAAGRQRDWPTRYTTEDEDAVLEEMGWRQWSARTLRLRRRSWPLRGRVATRARSQPTTAAVTNAATIGLAASSTSRRPLINGPLRRSYVALARARSEATRPLASRLSFRIAGLERAGVNTTVNDNPKWTP